MSVMNLVGRRFGRLVVIEKVPRERKDSYWLCRCDCGGETIANTYSLNSGHTSSCGCYNREKVAENGRRTKKYNAYTIEGDTVYVDVGNGKTMLCDVEDWERLKYMMWNASGRGYANARNTKTGKTARFHIEVMGNRDGLVVDHINRNKLDNRKSNLRFVTQRANTINKTIQKNNNTGTMGVRFRNGKWEACVWVNRKKICVGRFESKEDAIIAREKAEEIYYKPLFGE